MDKSLKEKLALIDQEIQTIHHFFLSKSFTPLEIEKGAQPFLKAVNQAQRKAFAWRMLKVVVVLMAFILLVRYDPVYKLILLYGRLASVNLLLPLYDWRHLYLDDCVIRNPYFERQPLTVRDCEVCESYDSIPRLSNLSTKIVMREFLQRDAPFIVTDATRNWPALQKFDLKFLTKLYTEHPILKNYLGCNVLTNLRIKSGNHKLLLKQAAAGSVNNWYAEWENCLMPAAKVLREYYERPYFLPPGVEVQNTNWILVSHNYKGKVFKPFPLEAPFVWLAQLRGETRVRLLPKKECEHVCQSLEEVIREGEIFVATDQLWLIDYLPDGPGENTAIAVGGNFD